MNQNSKWKRTVTVVAIAAASVGIWEGGSALVENVQFARAEQQVESTRQQLSQVQDLSTVFRNVGKVIEPSVVEIQVTKTIKGHRRMMPDDDFLRRFFGQQFPGDQGDQNNNDDNGQNAPNSPNGGGDDEGDMREVGTGSGVIMEVDGSEAYILTNNHVAGGASKLIVTLSDGRTISGTDAKTIGADPKSDLAVVKVHADHLIAAKWGDSSQLQRGDWVLAFGAPFGYVGSMTHGIVSALDRSHVGIIDQGQGYEDFIQVDAPINPGNSGGPLVDIHGDVVGVNTAIASRSGAFSGIGFAIPSNSARVIFNDLKSHGKVVRGWLGVSIENVGDEPDLAKDSGFTGDNGVLVREVFQGTPAYGKLQPGDVITAINGKHVTNRDELRNTVAMIAPNTEATLSVFRDGKTQDVPVKLGTQPEDLEAVASGQGHSGDQQSGEMASSLEDLGLRVTDVTDSLASRYGLGDTRNGALVTEVAPNSPAAAAGLQPGDLITRVNGQKIENAEDADTVIGKQDLSKGVRLYITNRAGYALRFLQSKK